MTRNVRLYFVYLIDAFNSSLKNVDPLQTFWVSPDYYERASEYYQNTNAVSIIRQDGIKEKNEERET